MAGSFASVKMLAILQINCNYDSPSSSSVNFEQLNILTKKIRNLWFSTEHYHLNKGLRGFCIFPCLLITSPFFLDLTRIRKYSSASTKFSLFLYPPHSIFLCLSHVRLPTVTQSGSPRFPRKWLQLNIQNLLWAPFNLNSWMLGPFPSRTWVFHVCKTLSNCSCTKALHRKTFQSFKLPPHWEGRWKDPRMGQKHLAAQNPRANTECIQQLLLKGYEDNPTGLHHKRPCNYSTALSAEPCRNSSSKATWVPHHHTIPQLHTHVFLVYCYWINWQSPTIAKDSRYLSCQVKVKLQPRCISVHWSACTIHDRYTWQKWSPTWKASCWY